MPYTRRQQEKTGFRKIKLSVLQDQTSGGPFKACVKASKPPSVPLEFDFF